MLQSTVVEMDRQPLRVSVGTGRGAGGVFGDSVLRRVDGLASIVSEDGEDASQEAGKVAPFLQLSGVVRLDFE